MLRNEKGGPAALYAWAQRHGAALCVLLPLSLIHI